MNVNWQALVECKRSQYGQALQWKNAIKVEKIKPKLNYVPYILIKNQHSDKIQHESFRNLVEVVCKVYKVSFNFILI